jgi:hypothetical protein
MSIHVEKEASGTFKVTVKAESTTEHTVKLDEAYYQKLTGATVPPETLIAKSFEFLLAREPNTSILRRFDLSEIARYFPEYERLIRMSLS